MIVLLDVGNSQIYIGVIQKEKLIAQFRFSSSSNMSSDQFGIFLKSALRENQLDPINVEDIVVSSVVPDLDYSLIAACMKYFNLSPLLLKAGIKTGIKIKYHNPNEVGADRIANAVGGADIFPDTNIVIVDFGTATTLCAINKNKEYFGGAILPGMKTSAKALNDMTAKLPIVEITKPKEFIARSTSEVIQIGLYYGQLGAVKEITEQMKINVFKNEEFKIIATGGFSYLFKDTQIFDKIVPDLVLKGLNKIYKLNKNG